MTAEISEFQSKACQKSGSRLQRIVFQHVFPRGRGHRKNARVSRVCLRSEAMSLLFVDISLQRSADAKKLSFALQRYLRTGIAMTMAAAIEGRKAGAPAWSTSSRIAAVDIFTNIDDVETIWRSLESRHHLSTPYQRFDFLCPWQKMVGTL